MDGFFMVLFKHRKKDLSHNGKDLIRKNGLAVNKPLYA
jgi:hypothetical protein